MVLLEFALVVIAAPAAVALVVALAAPKQTTGRSRSSPGF
jgi:hypothetical protein